MLSDLPGIIYLIASAGALVLLGYWIGWRKGWNEASAVYAPKGWKRPKE
jgi:hypothetical protein